MTEETPKCYKIIELRVQGIKRISAVTIRPDGPLVQIAGANDQGKTSVLDSVEWLFAGKRAIQSKPIRTGQDEALIKADLGDIKVTRTFTATGDGGYTTSLKVVGADGSRFQNEQGVLNALLGDFAFDPMAFTRMKPEDQFAAVRALVPGVDFDAIQKADEDDYTARTDANRKAKDRRTQANAISLPSGAIPKPVDLGALETKLGEAASHNVDVERRRGAQERDRLAISARQDDIASLKVRIEQMEYECRVIQKRLDDADPLPETIDVSAARQQLEQGRAANAVSAQAARRDALEKEADEAEAESKRLTRAMEERETAKQAAIAAANMPVQGLSFGAGRVLLNGEPFDQASRAQQWMAAVGIAAALNPRLRVIRVLDGSLLDDGMMRALAQKAEELDLQVWIERVDTSGEVGFVLEDGHLKGDAPPVVKAPADEDVI